MLKKLRKLTNDQLSNRRDEIISKIIKCEKESHYDNNSHCGLMVDYELVNEYYNDLITDLIDVLLEITTRTDYLATR